MNAERHGKGKSKGFRCEGLRRALGVNIMDEIRNRDNK